MKPVSAELHLPDLPEVPVAIGADGAAASPEACGWRERLRRGLATVLPLALMVLLAVLSWWLVRLAPKAEAPEGPKTLRHEPDYQLEGFQIQRYRADGAPSLRLQGERLRHYPDTDEHEVDTVHLWLSGEDGRETEATARSAVVAGDGSRVTLRGDVVVDSRAQGQEPVRLEGQQLLVLVTERQMRTDQPVRVQQGQSQFTAAAMVYDEPTRKLDLLGQVRATLTPIKGRRP